MTAVPHKSIVRREPKPEAPLADATAPHKSIVRREPRVVAPTVVQQPHKSIVRREPWPPAQADTVPAIVTAPLFSGNTIATHKKLVREEAVPAAAVVAPPTTPRKKMVREEPVPVVVAGAAAHVPLMRREPKVLKPVVPPHSWVRREAKLAPGAATGLSSIDRHTLIVCLFALIALGGFAKQAHSAFMMLLSSPALEPMLKNKKGVQWAGLSGIGMPEKSTQ